MRSTKSRKNFVMEFHNKRVRAPTTRKLIKFLAATVKELSKESSSLKTDLSDARQIALMLFFASILQGAMDAAILMQRNRFANVPLIFRSIFEAFVDIQNLTKDATYLKNLEYESLNGYLELLHSPNGALNPYLSEVKLIPDYEERMIEYESERTRLIKEGGRKVRIKEKFTLASMENEYKTLYKILCFYSHNAISALTERHLVAKGKAIKSIAMNKPIKLGIVEPYVFGLISYVLLSADIVSNEHDGALSKCVNKRGLEFMKLSKRMDDYIRYGKTLRRRIQKQKS